MEKTIRALTVAFYSVFILLIGYITLASLVADFSPLTLITLLLFLPGIYFIRRAIFKHDAFMLKHYKKLLFFFAAFMLILQIIFGCILRFDPVFDMDAIYGGAIELSLIHILRLLLLLPHPQQSTRSRIIHMMPSSQPHPPLLPPQPQQSINIKMIQIKLSRCV